MIAQRLKGVARLHFWVELTLLSGLYWVWGGLFELLGHRVVGSSAPYELYWLCFLVGMGLEYLSRGTHHEQMVYGDLRAGFSLALRQLAFAWGTVFVFLVAAKDSGMSRLFLFSLMPPTAVALMVANRKLPVELARRVFSTRRAERVLLIGPLAKATLLRSWLAGKEVLGLKVTGLLTWDAPPAKPCWPPVLGTPDDLEAVVERWGIKDVVLVGLPKNGALAGAVDTCERLGLRLMAVDDLEDLLRAGLTVSRDQGMFMFGLRHEPLEDPFNRFLKRALDIGVALPVVVGILPWTTLWVWLLQRWQSPGPVFFRQTRCGYRGKPFTIFKYRTMHCGNAHETEQVHRKDARVFRAGRWLRHSSIDELPQFWNVLLGDMSVVGPRPHMPEHDSRFERVMHGYRVRFFVKPGITGWAQVSGYRGEVMTEEDVVNRAKSDLFYLETWCMKLDCLIILKTAWQMLRPPRTAY